MGPLGGNLWKSTITLSIFEMSWAIERFRLVESIRGLIGRNQLFHARQPTTVGGSIFTRPRNCVLDFVIIPAPNSRQPTTSTHRLWFRQFLSFRIWIAVKAIIRLTQMWLITHGDLFRRWRSWISLNDTSKCNWIQIRIQSHISFYRSVNTSSREANNRIRVISQSQLHIWHLICFIIILLLLFSFRFERERERKKNQYLAQSM